LLLVQFFFTGLVALVPLCMRHILVGEIEGRYRLVVDALRDDIYLGCSMFRHCGLSKVHNADASY
jgi:hypothetical protein